MSSVPTQAVLQEMFDRVQMHTVSVFSIRALQDRGVYSGTGILVYAKGPCLLTAAHVWDLLNERKPESFGLTGRAREGQKGIAVPTSLQVARHRGTRLEPDIALIRLPEIDASTAQIGGKVFYNLDRRRAEADVSDSAPSLWGVFGSPGEQVAPSEAEQQWLMGTGIFASYAAPLRSERDGFDYAEIRTWNDGRDGRPQSYAGLSGSGLWRLGVRQQEGAVVWDGSLTLEGVAFYQEYDTQAKRGIIRCHGRKSIYRVVDGA